MILPSIRPYYRGYGPGCKASNWNSCHRHAIDLPGVPYIYWWRTRKGYVLSRRSGYSAQKRRRELAKQKKKEAKKERKLHRDEQDEQALVAEYLGLEVESEEETDEESEDAEHSEDSID
jgi:hypothetical protein